MLFQSCNCITVPPALIIAWLTVCCEPSAITGLGYVFVSVTICAMSKPSFNEAQGHFAGAVGLHGMQWHSHVQGGGVLTA